MPQLNVKTQVTAFQDTQNVSAPLQKYVDWLRNQNGIEVTEVFSQRFTVPAGVTQSLFSVTPVSGIGDTYTSKIVPAITTELQLRASGSALNALSSSIALPGDSYTFAALPDGTWWLTYGGAAVGAFASLFPGAVLYIAGSQFNDTGPWNIANQGFWTVVRVETVVRAQDRIVIIPPFVDPVAETVAAVAATDLQLVNNPAKWVLMGGATGSNAAFSGLFPILHAAKGWITIPYSTSLPIASGISFTTFTVTGLFVTYFRVEADQFVDVILDGGFIIHVKPVVAGDVQQMGWAENFGFSTSLDIVNNSPQAAVVNVIHAIQE